MSCKTCAYPKPLCLAVYCRKDPMLRELPAAPELVAGTPLSQAPAPEWCPLATCPDSATNPASPCA